ncbi:MAG: hypothetical protein B7Z33_14065 [Sphingomonadales bacterium 12-68-11]|nr:MAG: hypothetical protein B7Z33_14065 [Sphingomonadales bacterium 12-68-11]OYX16811.1 MAG: hypothetical protein B7Z07_01870 [Sphingomonadales bacterium 32-67-7]
MFHLIPAPLHRAALRVAHWLRGTLRRWFKPNLSGVTLVAVDGESRVLLVRHSYGGGGWSLPGGGLKRGEDPVAAVRREAREELGCDLWGDLRALPPLRDTLSGAAHVGYLFVGQLAGRPRPDGREVIDARFFALDALPANIGRVAMRRIEHYRAHRG